MARTSRIDGSVSARRPRTPNGSDRQDPRRQPGLGAARPALLAFGGAGQQRVGDPLERARGRSAELGGGDDHRCQQADGAAGSVGPGRARRARPRPRARARAASGNGRRPGAVAASASATAEVSELPARTPAATRSHHAGDLDLAGAVRTAAAGQPLPGACAESPAATAAARSSSARSRPPTMTSDERADDPGADGRVHVRTRRDPPDDRVAVDDRAQRRRRRRRRPRRSRRPAGHRRRRGRGGRRRRSSGSGAGARRPAATPARPG